MPAVVICLVFAALVVLTDLPDWCMALYSAFALAVAYAWVREQQLWREERREDALYLWRTNRWKRRWCTADCHAHDCRNLSENWDYEGIAGHCMFSELPPETWEERPDICEHYAWADEFPEGEEALADWLMDEPKVREAAERAGK